MNYNKNNKNNDTDTYVISKLNTFLNCINL